MSQGGFNSLRNEISSNSKGALEESSYAKYSFKSKPGLTLAELITFAQSYELADKEAFAIESKELLSTNVIHDNQSNPKTIDETDCSYGIEAINKVKPSTSMNIKRPFSHNPFLSDNPVVEQQSPTYNYHQKPASNQQQQPAFNQQQQPSSNQQQQQPGLFHQPQSSCFYPQPAPPLAQLHSYITHTDAYHGKSNTFPHEAAPRKYNLFPSIRALTVVENSHILRAAHIAPRETLLVAGAASLAISKQHVGQNIRRVVKR